MAIFTPDEVRRLLRVTYSLEGPPAKKESPKMCHQSIYVFVSDALKPWNLTGWDVLEVGSYDVNGSVRDLVTHERPASYLGVDIEEGKGVDEVCHVDELEKTYGADRFDLVLSTEMLEHVEDWRPAVVNLKAVTKPGGLLLVTTRSAGFPYHGYPDDCWRYELDDMRAIFADFNILRLEADTFPGHVGVLMLARKPGAPVDLDRIRLFSMSLNGRGQAEAHDRGTGG